MSEGVGCQKDDLVVVDGAAGTVRSSLPQLKLILIFSGREKTEGGLDAGVTRLLFQLESSLLGLRNDDKTNESGFVWDMTGWVLAESDLSSLKLNVGWWAILVGAYEYYIAALHFGSA
ncbi:hypothetical protein EG327_002344 [Venturia inaequalis]|uniref:Uncharacterized protein n=1 Tax=Venturia inaequalis TaxID=5025 RepID=A0A8H3VMR2_VENIN|nr:hypothetical protein EG327_002344 [Venturia inaequalis]